MLVIGLKEYLRNVKEPMDKEKREGTRLGKGRRALTKHHHVASIVRLTVDNKPTFPSS